MSKPNQQGTQAQTEFKKRRQRRRVQREPGDQAAANKQSVGPGVAALDASRSRPATLRRAEDAGRGGNGGQPDLAFDAGMLFEGGTVEAQAQVLQRLDGTQRQKAIQRIARMQGNQHVQRVVAAYGGNGQRRVSPPVAVQAKLEVGEPDDAYEREADAVADEVMLMREPLAASPSSSDGSSPTEGDNGTPTVSRLPSAPDVSGLPGGDGAGKAKVAATDTLARAPEIEHVEEERDPSEVERLGLVAAPPPPPDGEEEGNGLPAVSASLEGRIGKMKGGGSPLPPSEREFFEGRFETDFGGVRVHTGEAAAQTAQELGARAYTTGTDIAFGAGEYAPGTERGRRLMAHELTHVVQQGGAGKLSPQRRAKVNRCTSPDCRAQTALMKSPLQRQPAAGTVQALPGLQAKANRCATPDCRAQAVLMKAPLQRRAAAGMVQTSPRLRTKANRCSTPGCMAQTVLLKAKSSEQRQGAEEPAARKPAAPKQLAFRQDTPEDDPAALQETQPLETEPAPDAPLPSEQLAQEQLVPLPEKDATVEAMPEPEPHKAAAELPVERLPLTAEAPSAKDNGGPSAALSDFAPDKSVAPTPVKIPEDGVDLGAAWQQHRQGKAASELPNLKGMSLHSAWAAAREYVENAKAASRSAAQEKLAAVAGREWPKPKPLEGASAAAPAPPAEAAVPPVEAQTFEAKLPQEPEPPPHPAKAEALVEQPASPAELPEAEAPPPAAPEMPEPAAEAALFDVLDVGMVPDAMPENGRDRATVVQRSAVPGVQRFGLEDLIPQWAKNLLSSLRGDAAAKKGDLRADGSSTGRDLDRGAKDEGQVLAGDGERTGAEIEADGEAQEGELQAAQAEQEAELQAAQAEQEAELLAAQTEQEAELQAAQEEASVGLEADEASVQTELEADAETANVEFEADVEGQVELLEADAEAAEAELQADAEGQAQAMEGEWAGVQQEEAALEAELTQEVESETEILEMQASQAEAQVAEGWAELQGDAEQLVQELDTEAGEVCAVCQEQIDGFLSGTIDPLIEDVQARVDQAKAWAQGQWDAFMEKAKPAMDWIKGQWQAFSTWANESVWQPLSQKASEIAEVVGEKVGQAWEWAQGAWANLTALWANVQEFLSAGGDRIREWIAGRADAAREWIAGRADAAREWLNGRADAAIEWLSGRADAAREWIAGKTEAALDFINGKADAAVEWISGKADTAREWITGKADAAREWIAGRADAANAWIDERATSIVNGFSERGHSIVSGLTGRASSAVSAISSRGGAIGKWFGGIVSGLIGGVRSVGNWAVSTATKALDGGLGFLSNVASTAIQTVQRLSTWSVDLVSNAATGAITVVENVATGAVNVVRNVGVGVVTGVSSVATGVVNKVEAAATGAVNLLRNAALGVVDGFEALATGAVTWAEERATALVTAIENAIRLAIELAQQAWENIKVGWEALKGLLGLALSWLGEKIGQLASWVNENVIQPVSQWASEQWAKLKQSIQEAFPGLTACWEAFQEMAGAVWERIQAFPIIGPALNILIDILEGMLLGDFMSDPNGWNMLGMVLIGFIPGVDQLADIRDLLGCLWKVVNGEAGWLDVGLALVAFIPMIGNLGKYTDEVADAAGLVAKYGDDLTEIGIEMVTKYGDDAVEILTKHGPEALDLVAKYGDEGLEIITQYGDEGLEVLAKYGDEGIETLSEYGDEGIEMLQQGVVAKTPTPDGHEVKVLADGRVVRCSECGVLKIQYAEELAANPDLARRLDEIEQMSDPVRKAEEAAKLTDELSDIQARTWPQSRKPDFGEPGAAEWRYQRYLEKKGADEALDFETWKRQHFDPAARGGRPGRPGGPEQVAAKNELADEGVIITERVRLGGRGPDGYAPNASGGTDYYEVGEMLKGGIPESRERIKLVDEIDALGEDDTVTFVSKTDTTHRITYEPGDDPDIKK